MSTIQKNQTIWSNANEKPDSKYEKCRNITEEIYKRINLTFQIKKLEGTQSDVSYNSDHIDSNELSNETDLFACDKSDCISSSTEAEKPMGTCEKYININNNEETKKKTPIITKRPKKKFRKRIKKRQLKTADSDGSSDEAPLSRIVEVPKVKSCSESSDHIMGVPNIIIITKDLKNPKIRERPKEIDTQMNDKQNELPQDTQKPTEKQKAACEWKHCDLCSLSFRGDRGLRRHLSMSHVITPANKGPTQQSNE